VGVKFGAGSLRFTQGRLRPWPSGDFIAHPEHPVLGRVTIFLYSLRKSSSGVGFWKNSIHGFIISTDM